MRQINKILEGYKDSPLGIIPKEWEVKRLGDLGAFSKGKGVPKDKIIDKGYKGYKCLTYGDIYTKYDIVMKNVKSFIDAGTAEESQEIQKGDILFTSSGETLEDIGKAIVYLDDENGYAGGDIIIFKNSEPINSLWLSYFLNSSTANSQKYKMGQGHSVVHIYSSQLEKLKILLPPLPEQQKIAEILSLWYEAIEKQTQLIAQLETRKRGLMQQLLTGKKRLKGFSGEWKKVKIGEIGDVFSGGTPDTTNMSYWNGNINWCTPTDISALNEEKYIGNTITKITQEGLNNSSAILLPKGSIIVCTRATIGKVVITNEDISTNQGFKNIVPNKKINTEFLYYSLLSLETTLLRLGNGSTFLEVSKKDFKNIQIFCPAFSEQTAIANILSISDNELSLSKQKLAGLKDQKKGLIQQLLTGKKRIKLL